MKSLFALTWAVCLSVCFALVPSAVFAQSTGTFTVNKDFDDDSPASVNINLSCTNGHTDSASASEGSPAVFTNIPNVIALDSIYTWTQCSATESPVPLGYSQADIDCQDLYFSPDTSTTASTSCIIENTAVCGDAIQTVGEQCDNGIGNGAPEGSCCSSECTFVANATACHSSDGVCDAEEVCSGTSALCPADLLEAQGTECNASLGVCDEAEVCTGTSPLCPADVLVLVDTECRGSTGECDVAETCTGSSAACPTDGFAAEGTLCGVAPDFSCDAQDICTGTADTCIPNPDPLAACGVIGKGDGCELNICDDEGPSDFRLLFTPDLPNWVAYKLNASNPGQLFYSLVSEPDVPNDANLLLQVPFPFVTQGNMTLHVFDADDAYTEDLCLVIGEDAESTPYPVEITMDTYWGEEGPCAEPSSINPPTEPGAYCKHVTGPNPEDYVPACPSDYDPNNDAGLDFPPALALQECWAYYPVELENVGQFAARLHLDYGLKGKHLDTYCPADGNVDRYAPGGKGDYGDFDALEIDINDSSTINYLLNACNIPTCQPYTFAHGVESDQPSDCYSAHGGIGCDNEACEDTVCTADAYCCDTSWDSKCADEAADLCDADLVAPVDPVESVIESVNYFKKPTGVFGQVFCDADDDGDGPGYAGLTVELRKGGITTVATALTDADGLYFLNYKHKGKPQFFEVHVSAGAFEVDNYLPGVPLQANGFAEQDFRNIDVLCDPEDPDAGSPDWVVDPYSITKGKFKTIVNP